MAGWYNETDAASEVSWVVVVASSDEGTHSMKLSEDYIVGLVDGEGSFTAYVRNPRDSSVRIRRVKVEPRFYIKLIEKDKNILFALRAYFRCGNVYFQRDQRKNHQNCYRFEVGNRADLENVIIPFFRKHPLRIPSKIHDFTLFCEIMSRIRRKEHLTEHGLARLYRLKAKMH